MQRRTFNLLSLTTALTATLPLPRHAFAQDTQSLAFDPDAFETLTEAVETDSGTVNVTYRFWRAIPYVARPVDVAHQSLNISVPVEIDGVAVDAGIGLDEGHGGIALQPGDDVGDVVRIAGELEKKFSSLPRKFAGRSTITSGGAGARRAGGTSTTRTGGAGVAQAQSASAQSDAIRRPKLMRFIDSPLIIA